MATGGVVRWAVGSFTSSGVPQCVHLCYWLFSAMCFMPRNGDQKSRTKIAATWSLSGPLRGWEGDVLGVHSFWALGPQRLTTQKGKFHLSSYPSLYPSRLPLCHTQPAGLAPWVQGEGGGGGGEEIKGRGKGEVHGETSMKIQKANTRQNDKPQATRPRGTTAPLLLTMQFVELPVSLSLCFPQWTHRWTRLRVRLAGKVL